MDKQEFKETEPQKVVAGVIFSDSRDEVLVAKRSKGKPFAGKWEFIGGKVDKGESLERAVRREVFEEISKVVEPIGRLGEGNFISPEGTNMHVTFIECDVISGSLAEIRTDPKVQSRIKWVKIEDLPKQDWVGQNGDFAKWLVDFEKHRKPYRPTFD